MFNPNIFEHFHDEAIAFENFFYEFHTIYLTTID